DHRGVRWRCHHCTWSGGGFYDEKPSRQGSAGAPVGIVKTNPAADDRGRKQGITVRLWRETGALPGKPAGRYFLQQRKINITSLDLSHVLRWHASDRMVLARMSDPLTGEELGIHRTFLDQRGQKFDRKMLGYGGIARLWPDEAVTQGLVIGEGIET